MKQVQVLSDGGDGVDKKVVVAEVKELERQLAEVRKEYKDYKLKKEEEDTIMTGVLEKMKNEVVEVNKQLALQVRRNMEVLKVEKVEDLSLGEQAAHRTAAPPGLVDLVGA